MQTSFHTRSASIATRLIHRAIQTGDLMWLVKHGPSFKTFTHKDAVALEATKKLDMRSVVGVYDAMAEADRIVDDMEYVMKVKK